MSNAGDCTTASPCLLGTIATGALTLTLPTGVQLQSSVPGGASVSGQHVTWSGLADASGSIKARVQISGVLVSGTVLPFDVTVSDSSGATAGASGVTSVR